MKIHLKEMKIPASVGIFLHEKQRKTNIVISVTITLPSPESFCEAEILDYDKPIKLIKQTVATKHYEYIEEIASTLRTEILKMDTKIQEVNIKVQKCIFGNILGEVSVEIP